MSGMDLLAGRFSCSQTKVKNATAIQNEDHVQIIERGAPFLAKHIELKAMQISE
jgi:hypothetical protein